MDLTKHQLMLWLSISAALAVVTAAPIADGLLLRDRRAASTHCLEGNALRCQVEYFRARRVCAHGLHTQCLRLLTDLGWQTPVTRMERTVTEPPAPQCECSLLIIDYDDQGRQIVDDVPYPFDCQGGSLSRCPTNRQSAQRAFQYYHDKLIRQTRKYTMSYNNL